MNQGKETAEDIILSYIDNNGTSISWLARRTGVSPSHMRNMLKSKGHMKRTLKPEYIKRIADVLKIEIPTTEQPAGSPEINS